MTGRAEPGAGQHRTLYGRDELWILIHQMESRANDLTAWCEVNGIDSRAVDVVRALFGHSDLSSEAAIGCFQLGWEARRDAEPRGQQREMRRLKRYAVQYTVIDTTDGSLAWPPICSAQYAFELADVFNLMDSHQ